MFALYQVVFVEGVNQPTEQLVSFDCRKKVYTETSTCQHSKYYWPDPAFCTFLATLLYFFSALLGHTHKGFLR